MLIFSKSCSLRLQLSLYQNIFFKKKKKVYSKTFSIKEKLENYKTIERERERERESIYVLKLNFLNFPVKRK